ncbi:MAG: hypothetical protein KGH55_00345 [Nanoarchaeota archaeon]|nr:hypothetical protein [Nanoarchaeota archaeon]
MVDASLMREKILYLIKMHGPSLPVFIAKETGLSILFASAFLSELLSNKELRISNLRVGSSPLYFIPGQEPLLENFSQYLKNKEKDAFMLLKEKRFLTDKELEPAIRVAMRDIKDFAVPFEKDGEVLWRFFTSQESDFIPQFKKVEIQLNVEETAQEPAREAITEIMTEIKSPVEEIESVESEEQERKPRKPIKRPQKPTKKKSQDNKFFNKVKELLSKKKIEIIDIEEISINRIIFRVKDHEEYLIIAYNKRKISEQDIISSYKKSHELKLQYKIWALGEPVKKFDNLMAALKSMRGLEKIE